MRGRWFRALGLRVVATVAIAILTVMGMPAVAQATVISGSTWFSDGTRAKQVNLGDRISAFATGATPGVAYQLVIGDARIHPTQGCFDLDYIVNQNTRWATADGFIGTTSGPAGDASLPPGTYQVCFRAINLTTATAPVLLTIGSGPPTKTTPVAAGADHSLSVKPDGSVFAWGKNTYGQLGNGTTTDSPGGVPVAGLTSVVSVAAGDRHSLALRSDGTVWGWGSNEMGQLGDGWTNDTADVPRVLSPVPALEMTGAVAVAAGCDHSLALGVDGNVWAWGNNGSGQLGVAGGGISPVRAHVPGLANIRGISAGCGWSLAFDATGRAWAWGDNTYGQLGDGTTTSRYVPKTVPANMPIEEVAAGAHHALARSPFDWVYAWGDNTYGQIGDGTTGGIRSGPVILQYGGTGIAAGSTHSVLVRAWNCRPDSIERCDVLAWGANDRHQLGNLTTTPSNTPTPVFKDAGGTHLNGNYAVAAGGKHTVLVAAADSRVFSFGQHSDGTDCVYATYEPGPDRSTLPTGGINPPPMPPNPECEAQAPTPPAVYGLLDSRQRATSASRSLNSAVLRASVPRPTINFDPVGFPNPNPLPPNQWDRSHLLAYIFGGVSTQAEGGQANIAALHKQANQQPLGMQRYEREIKGRLVSNCETIQFDVVANNPTVCSGTGCAPTSMHLTASGDKGYTLDCIVVNSTTPIVCPGH